MSDQPQKSQSHYATANEATKAKASTIKTQIKMVPEIGEADVLEYIAGIIGVEPADMMERTEA